MDTKATQDELYKEVRKTSRRKTPSNIGLYLAIIFFNLVMLSLDIGSAFSVYWATGITFYAIMCFVAGVVPLALHEVLFIRPYASDDQKVIAQYGAFAAVGAVVIIAILSAIVNVMGITGKAVEISLLIFIVVSAFGHALASAAYFYIDDGVKSESITVQMEARAEQKRRRNDAANYVLGLSRESIEQRKVTASKHGSMAALREILRQMGEDDDGDGIPNALDTHDNRRDRPQNLQPSRSFQQTMAIEDNPIIANRENDRPS